MQALGRLVAVSALTALSAGCSSAAPPSAVGAFTDPAPTATAPAPSTSVDPPVVVTSVMPAVPNSNPLVPPSVVPSDVDVAVEVEVDVDLGLVAVVGDSLTQSAAEVVEAELVRIGVDRVVVDGLASRRLTSGSSELPSGRSAIAAILADERPDLWVVALGTNDVSAGSDAESFGSAVASVLDSIPPDAPVVWVDLWLRDRRAETVEANLVLRDVLAGRSAPTAVVSWYSAAAAPGNVIRDGVHLTDEGRERFAREISAVVVGLALGDATR